MSPVLWVLALLETATPLGLEPLAQSLDEQLGLSFLAERPIDLVVSTEPEEAPPALEALATALRARLEARHQRQLRLRGDDATLIAAGAEWRLSLRLVEDQVEATLRELDPGLWGPGGPRPPQATARVALPNTPISDPPPTIKPEGRPRLGPLTPLAVLPDATWALAACGPPDGPELLFVLEASRLSVYRVDARRLEPWAELSLAEQAPALPAVRAPFGNLACGEADASGIEVGLGTGRLADGLLVRFDPKTRRLQITARLPGIPLAKLPSGWLLGRPDLGRNRYGQWALHRPDGSSGPQKLEQPLYQVGPILSDDGRAQAVYAVDLEYRLWLYDLRLQATRTGEQSGVGLSGRRIFDQRALLLTAPSADQERIGLLGGTSAPVDGPVVASTIGRFGVHRYGAVLAVDRGPRGTTLHYAELSGGGP